MIARLLARWRNRSDPAWAPCGYRYTAEGFDPELRERTLVKREREDRARRAAARIASSPALTEAERRLRVVGGER